MTILVETVTSAYKVLFTCGDPRVESWFLMGNPVPIFTIIFLYVLFVKKIGPSWMEDKKPFNLRYQMVLYNFALVFVNGYIFTQIVDVFLTAGPNFTCRTDNTSRPGDVKLRELAWWYLLSRLIEFIDTVFFILRKKSNQISQLHVIHHTVVPLAVWLVLQIEPGSTYNFFFPLINLLVHVIMYSYYGFAALGPRVQRYLFWKKYLTALQMIQFVSVFFFYTTLMVRNCAVTKLTISINLFLATLFLALFYNFFRNTYLKRKTSTKGNALAGNQAATNLRKVTYEDSQVGKKSN